jgi:DNA-binding response OmpR family regulator
MQMPYDIIDIMSCGVIPLKKLLIVEDDRALRAGLCRSLASNEIETESAATIAEARAKFHAGKYDLVLLDCNLPDGNGVDFCTEIRRTGPVPVIFLTVLDSELDEVAAFRAGGIDYVKKPFSLMVLQERINAALARTDGGLVYAEGRYRFDFGAMTFSVDGSDVVLSPTEQKLLRSLTANSGRIVPRPTLTEQIWACDGSFIDENALSVTVKRLRAKLGAECIKTVYGLGYMWVGGGA